MSRCFDNKKMITNYLKKTHKNSRLNFLVGHQQCVGTKLLIQNAKVLYSKTVKTYKKKTLKTLSLIKAS